MILEFVVFSLVAVSPSLNSVVKNFRSECRSEEFACSDGTCISVGLLCDGQTNCLEGEDEAMCDTGMGISKIGNDGGGLHRWRRQTSRCKNSQFRCRTGDCVPSDGKCDGIKDCPDGSDEAHALCRNLECPDHLFRCTYGACVDGYGKCDNITNCVDNSDELHPDCFAVPNSLPIPPPKEFTCDDGRQIPRTETCDGRADCADGSDETVRQCAANRCQSIHFQCAYGACVDSGSNCDGKVDCADGSDEAVDLCDDRIGTGTGATSRPTGTLPPPPVGTGNCVLPPFPDHGHYIVEGQPQVRPGQRLEAASLSITCDTGYKPTDDIKPFCFGNNGWSAAVPKCIQFCRLNQQRSVKYSCIVEGTQGGTRECPQYVPSGTRVIPACNTPNYYSRYPLRYMTCTNGEFDVIEICEPECGKVTPDGEVYVIGGWATQRGEFPWHVGIYKKDTRPYKQICGGSIVSSTLVISAAHCFYTDALKLHPANKYAVAAGKIYRPWDDPNDVGSQKSDVSDIKITERFRGSTTNYQEDIALVFLSKPFEYTTNVRPVCLDFDSIFNSDQLSPGKIGRIAGWGLTKEEGAASQILLTVNLPFINAGKCIDESPPGFQEYVTGDKFCAGYTNGTSLCKGDSGGGLVFAAQSERRITRYYLRGIVSTGPRNLEFTSCDSHFYTTFTEIQKHEMFIRTYYSRS